MVFVEPAVLIGPTFTGGTCLSSPSFQAGMSLALAFSSIGAPSSVQG